jgi:Sel1 repeat
MNARHRILFSLVTFGGLAVALVPMLAQTPPGVTGTPPAHAPIPAPPVTAAPQAPGAAVRPPVIRECDDLAGIRDPREPETREVSGETIDAGRAVSACKQAVAAMPGSPRYMVQYARALIAAKNDSEALVWFRKAADLGHPRALRGLGIIYYTGRGVPKDEAEAARWFRKAADQGDPVAQESLGWLYADGRGVGRDETEAARLFRLAADQGHSRALNSLGLLYLNGRG